MNKETFKAGDEVYCSLMGNKVITLHANPCKDYPLVVRDMCITLEGKTCRDKPCRQIFHATPENKQLLEALYKCEFESPKLKVGDVDRESFETSFRTRHLDEDLSNTLLEFDTLAGRYKIGYTNESYLSWQAAIKSQQSRIELYKNAIREDAEYHRGYVDKLKESDPDRSERQQERVNYFMDILEQAK